MADRDPRPKVSDIEIVKVYEVRCEICWSCPVVDVAPDWRSAVMARREHFFKEHRPAISSSKEPE